MSYQKTYGRINWENYPSDKTPLNEANLNKIDYAVNEVDNRILELDVKKLDLAVANGMVKSLTYNQANGVFTITYLNGSSDTIDTKLEKLAVNFSYDPTAQQLIITLDDGTTQKVDMSALITQYEFSDTDTVAFSVDGDGKVSADVKNGSITEDKLQPDYLADIKVQAANAQNSATAANDFAVKAESWAHGGTGTREDEDTDNSEYYFNQTKKIYDDFQTLGNVTGVKGAAETEYRHGNVDITPENIGLGNVPNVTTNNQTPTFTEAAVRENITSGEKLSTLFGKIMKWFSDLKAVAFSGSYNDLSHKPSIPAVVNNNTTTVAGYALDARQANPNIKGSLANQISVLNTDLKNLGNQFSALYDGTEVFLPQSNGYVEIPLSGDIKNYRSILFDVWVEPNLDSRRVMEISTIGLRNGFPVVLASSPSALSPYAISFLGYGVGGIAYASSGSSVHCRILGVK